MAPDQQWLPLDELVEDILDRRGVTPLKLGSGFTASGYRVISAKLIKERRIDLSADVARFVDGPTYHKWMKTPLLEDDVIMTSEAPLGEVAYIKERRDWCLGQRLFGIRTRKDVLHGRFLYYALQSEPVSHDLMSRASGTTVLGVRQTELRRVRIPVPPLSNQHRIADLLGSLDDKIELNRQMNETLEAMARAIFKSWFVDFDPVRAKQEGRAPFGMDAETAALFPDSFQESELGPIPKGWTVRSLDEIAEFLNGLALQRFPADGPDSLPVIKIRELRTGVDANSNRASRAIDERYVVKDGDLLFSWSGSLVVTQWAGGLGALNQHLFKVTSNDFPKWFVMGWLLAHLPEFRAIAADKATTMGHIKRHHLTDAKVVVPPDALIKRLTKIAEPLLERQLLNQLESRTLAELRDTLLPKLISGELRLPEAEELAEAAQ